ncbi:MAG TPA: hypothetical protein VFJ90_15420 [Candidatus Didemnitutus sp.]|nr:hypothetical protein [Candidatus Didemnitutus sp.]
MKSDRYFKFIVVTILSAVVLALINPGHTKQIRPVASATATTHS